MAGVDKALRLLKDLPRVGLNNLAPLPGTRKKKVLRRGSKGKTCGRGHKGQGQRGTLPRIGFEGGGTPFYLRIPQEPYYTNDPVRRQYPPLSLLKLQRMIDLGRIDTNEPIDLTTICNTKVYSINHLKKHYGINLTDEGADIFAAQVNIEVQRTNETVIAAIEKNGGIITTRFFDLMSVQAMQNPKVFFTKGIPIPRCKLPPEELVEYYTNPENRGYLADPDAVRESRIQLAQKYGYELPDLSKDPLYNMLMRRKDPRQIWYGLAPGWVINMRDKKILKPTDEGLKEYYTS